MRIGVPKETALGERRVALVPEAVQRLARAGHAVRVEAGAGVAAGFPDGAYREAGAVVVESGAAALGGAELALKVQRPSPAEVGALDEGAALAALLGPVPDAALLQLLARRRVTAFALERVPRITRAQSMDALSSQANIAGYKAVLLGASTLGRILPMMTTAAGTLAPARCFMVGAGVAGLQAVATARRLGAVVSAFDVRPAVKEQVSSLGATFLEVPGAVAEGADGYAAELAAEQQRRVEAALAGHIPAQDLVVASAQVPGRPAPRLISEAMVRSMRPGSVIVDLAAETGGNCACTRADETVDVAGVRVLGPTNLPATVPTHASQVYARNLLALVQLLSRDGQLAFDPADEILGAMAVTHAGEIRAR
jgi:NAD(P) transhydrogenase subunit alpha